MYPKVKFKIDQEFDVWKINEFLHREKRGDSFKKRIYAMHPDLKKSDNIKDYVARVYRDNLSKFKTTQKQIQNDWNKISQGFFEYQNKIFKNLPWPKGEYTGFLSISQPYPRFLDSATFQVDAFSPKRSMAITAHELGHFIFFEYVRNRYTPKSKKLNESKLNKALYNKLKTPLWELSEVHVVILMQSPEFQKIIRNQSLPYPEHEKHFKQCKKFWQKADENIDNLFNLIEK